MDTGLLVKPGYGPLRGRLRSGLVYSLPFLGGTIYDGLGSKARDHGLYRLDGTVNGAPTIVGERFGFAYKGDNSASNVQSGLSAFSKNIIKNTISIRFKRNTQSNKGIFTWAATDQDSFPWILLAEWGSDTTKVHWYFNTNYRVEQVLAAGVWTHHIATYDGTTWTVWIDGGIAGTFVGSYDGGSQWTNDSSNVFVGCGFGGFFAGWIDHVHIWDRALDDADVRSLFVDPFQMYRPAPPLSRSVRVYAVDADPVQPLAHPVSGVGFGLD